MREGSEHPKQAKSREVFRRLLVAVFIGCWIAAAPSGLGQELGSDQDATSNEEAHHGDGTPDSSGEPSQESSIAVDISEHKPPSGIANPSATEREARIEPDNNEQWMFMGDGLAQWVMTGLSTAAFVISIYGVILLLNTLRVTREIGEQQVRCYVLVEKAIYDPCLKKGIKEGDYIGGLKVELINSGATPATNVTYYAEAFLSIWSKMEEPVEPVDATFCMTLNSLRGNTSDPVDIIPFGQLDVVSNFREMISKFTIHTPLGQRPIVGIRGAIFYDDVFGKSFRSDFAFFLEEGFQDAPTIAMAGTCSERAFRTAERPKRKEIAR